MQLDAGQYLQQGKEAGYICGCGNGFLLALVSIAHIGLFYNMSYEYSKRILLQPRSALPTLKITGDCM